MASSSTGDVRLLAGRPFEDILDGYFPFRESVRQLLARQQFKAVWMTLLHAPVMNIEGLPYDAPVPMHLRKIYSGMIDHMLVSACGTEAKGAELTGIGDWFFTDPRDDTDVFPDTIRLAEPAFVRGIGIYDEDRGTGETVSCLAVSCSVDGDGTSRAARDNISGLGWGSCKSYMISPGASPEDRPGIVRGRAESPAAIPFTGGQSEPVSPLPPSPGFPSAGVLHVNTTPGHMDSRLLDVALSL